MSIVGIFRRFFNTLLETGSDILQTPSTHEGLNFFQLISLFEWAIAFGKIDPQTNPNLGKSFKVDKQTTIVFPVYLSTPPPHHSL